MTRRIDNAPTSGGANTTTQWTGFILTPRSWKARIRRAIAVLRGKP